MDGDLLMLSFTSAENLPALNNLIQIQCQIIDDVSFIFLLLFYSIRDQCSSPGDGKIDLVTVGTTERQTTTAHTQKNTSKIQLKIPFACTPKSMDKETEAVKSTHYTHYMHSIK